MGRFPPYPLPLLLLLLPLQCGGQFTAPCSFNTHSEAVRTLRSRLLACGSTQPDDSCNTTQKYDNTVPPAVTGPVIVRPTTLVTQVQDLNAQKGTFTISIYYREAWEDTRLTWTPASYCGITQVYLDSVPVRPWVPDSFFAGAQEVDSPNDEEYILVENSGTVLWSRRNVIQVGCATQFDFRTYPFETQRCSTQIESYGYPPELLRYGNPQTTDRFKVAISCSPSCPQEAGVFQMHAPDSDLTITTIGTQQFSALRYNFIFKRDASRYIVHFFLPLWLVVGMSFIGTFIAPEAAPARVAVAIISVLVLVNLSFGPLRSEIPLVRYTQAMDIYQLLCFFATLANTCEYAFINYLLTAAAHYKERSETRRKLRSLASLKEVPPQSVYSGSWKRLINAYFSDLLSEDLLLKLCLVFHKLTGGHWHLVEGINESDLVKHKFPAVLARAIVKKIQKMSQHQPDDEPLSSRISRMTPRGCEPIEPDEVTDPGDVDVRDIDFALGEWKTRTGRALSAHGLAAAAAQQRHEEQQMSLRHEQLRESFMLFCGGFQPCRELNPWTCNSNNRTITMNDLKAVLAGMEGVAPENVRGLLEEADVDADGTVNLPEFQKLASEKLTHFWATTDPHAFVICGFSVTKEKAKRFEARYRFWGPVLFFIVNVMWFSITVSLA